MIAGEVEIAPALFTNVNVFYQGVLYSAVLAQTARFDNVEVVFPPTAAWSPYNPDARPNMPLGTTARGAMPLGTAARPRMPLGTTTRPNMPLSTAARRNMTLDRSR